MNVQNLKKSRESMHLTQAQVAAKLGITSVAYQNYEYGKREPNNDLLCKIAELFCVTTDYLLGRETGEPDSPQQLADGFNMSVLERKMLDNYLSLSKATKDELMGSLRKSVREAQEESNPKKLEE